MASTTVDDLVSALAATTINDDHESTGAAALSQQTQETGVMPAVSPPPPVRVPEPMRADLSKVICGGWW